MAKRSATSEALRHLKKDKVLKKLIARSGELTIEKDTDLYLSLCRSIVSQQLSVKAAATIWKRFQGLFKEEYPHPKLLLKMDDEKLRACGLSYQKAGYLKNIAQFSIDKTFDYKKLKKLSDEDLIKHLIEIKGVGRWTIEMIMMFNLDRPDVFPKLDLGIQNGIRKLFDVPEPNKKEFLLKIEEIAERWRPYRTLACLYIWDYKDNAPIK